MLHLTLVLNLLSSIGAAPHLQRPNLPVTPGFYPPEVVVALRPFSDETLEHFIFLERPAGHDEEPARPDQRPRRPRQLVASAQDYTTVGQLYRGIEAGLTHLASTLGEERLFLGDRRVQVGPSLLALEGLETVHDLASARAAIERIIEQGEGARGFAARSHHDRFHDILDELRALKKARPAFEPARPVVTNPVMNRPAAGSPVVPVDAPLAARVLDLANASYGLMVQLLARFFGQFEPDETRRVLGDAAITLMSGAIAPLADLLTTLPASESVPGRTAGISFALPRSTHALPQREAAWALLEERAREIASACAGAPAEVSATLARVASVLRSVADRLRAGRPARSP